MAVCSGHRRVVEIYRDILPGVVLGDGEHLYGFESGKVVRVAHHTHLHTAGNVLVVGGQSELCPQRVDVHPERLGDGGGGR